MNLSISNSSLVRLAEAKGYSIKIYTTDEGHKTVVFSGQHSSNMKLNHAYTPDWSDDEIRNDCIHWLLSWANLHPVITLDFK